MTTTLPTLTRPERPLKPVLRYPGAKARIAPWIVSHFPPHAVYCEPFMGSLTVLFAKPRGMFEIANDTDGDVVNFFRVLRDQPDELARLVDLTPWAREEYASARESAEDPLERARRFAVRCWQSCNAGRNTGWHSQPRRGEGVPDSITWARLSKRLIPVAERLKGVQFECLPAIELIERCRSAEVLLYCDPPYPAETRASALYRFEMMEQDDHAALLDVLEAHPGPVLLSGYDHPIYNDRLARWQRSEITARAMHAQPRQEVLWLNPVAAAAQTGQLSLLGEE